MFAPVFFYSLSYLGVGSSNNLQNFARDLSLPLSVVNSGQVLLEVPSIVTSIVHGVHPRGQLGRDGLL